MNKQRLLRKNVPSVVKHDNLSNHKWTLLVNIFLIVTVGFGCVAVLTYRNALLGARKEATESILPLAIDAISNDLREEFTRAVLVAEGMAANTFITDWLNHGEQDSIPIIRYLQRVQRDFATTTAFFISAQTNRYYHPRGEIKTIDPSSQQDAWFYRLKNLDSPYEVNLDRDTAKLSRQTVFVNYKYLDRSGKFRGAIGVGYSTDVLSDLIRRSELQHDIRVLFLDPAGQTLTLNRSDQANLKGIHEMPGIGRYTDRIKSTEGTSFSYFINGEEYLLRSKRLPELGWHLVVSTPVRKYHRTLHSTLIQICFTGLICLALVMALVYKATTRHHAKLAQIACTDALTGSLNRHSFKKHWQTLHDRCTQSHSFAVALIDLDHFKQINDHHGHQAGDIVLQEFVRLLRHTLGTGNLIFRWGGEEFLLLMPDMTSQQASTMMHGIAGELNVSGIMCGSETIPVTFSAGVTTAFTDDTIKSILERADMALYQAKQGGRNKIVKL